MRAVIIKDHHQDSCQPREAGLVKESDFVQFCWKLLYEGPVLMCIQVHITGTQASISTLSKSV